jgi:hypothetical protein
MATPTSAIQIQMMQREFDRKLVSFRERVLVPFQNSLLDMICRRVIRRRPHTDDMMQMLVDLGIEPPDENMIIPTGLTIKWR